MRAGHLIAIAGFVTVVFATFPSKLVPSKRAVSLGRRSLWKRDIVPKDVVVLDYAATPYHPPSAIVTLFAHDDRPILLVDDFNYLLSGLSCHKAYFDKLEDVITLDFADEDAFELAVVEWTALQDLSVITAHPDCNSMDEHGIWFASAVIPDSLRSRLTLVVEPALMRNIVKSFGVKYDHNSARSWAARDVLGLSRRDEHGFDESFNFGYNPDIDARLPLFPPNTTLDDTVAESVISQLTDAQVELTCVGCTFTTNVTIGMDFQIDIANASCATSSQNCFTLNNAAMNLTIEQFEQHAALEVFIGDEVQAGADYKILWIPVAPALNVPSLIDLGPAIGIEIAFELDITSSINFTFGATGHVPSGAFASVSLVNSTGDWDPTVSATGWDGSGIDQIPFRVNAGDFNISTSMAFAPYAEISFTILDVGAALRLVQNMPKVGVNAALQANVNRQCEPIGADDFESFGTAFVVGSGMTLSTEAELILEKGEFVGHGIPDNWDLQLWGRDIPFTPALGINTTSCFVLSDGGISVNTTSGSAKADLRVDAALAGQPAPTGTLLAAQSAIPTWDFNKIESYYSANGHLPTNVNYGQMIQATTVPSNLQAAVTKAASSSSGAVRVVNAAENMSLWLASVVAMGLCILT